MFCMWLWKPGAETDKQKSMSYGFTYSSILAVHEVVKQVLLQNWA